MITKTERITIMNMMTRRNTKRNTKRNIIMMVMTRMKEKKCNYYSLLSLLLIKYNLRLFIIIVVFVANLLNSNITTITIKK